MATPEAALSGRRLRVLWFVNLPLEAVCRRAGAGVAVVGGWLDAGRAALVASGRVDLAVVTAAPLSCDTFCEDGITYFTITEPGPRSGLGGALRGWRHPIGSRETLDRCLRTLRTWDPDIVHVHGTERLFGLVAERVETPVVVSLQGILREYVEAYFKGWRRRDVMRLACDGEFVKGRGLLHSCWTMRRGARREAAIVARVGGFLGRTEWDRQYVREVRPEAPYFRCPEVMRRSFYVGGWRPDAVAAEPTLYCTGSAAPYKGLECLLAALARLRRSRWPGLRLRLSGEILASPMGPVMRRWTTRLGLSDAVDWLGPLSAEKVVEELENAWAFVLPSHIENSPNSLCEAMLVGAPCVASRVGGVPTLVSDGSDGILFQDGADTELAGVLDVVLGDRGLAARLGAKARRTAMRRHAPEAAAQAMVSAYDAVLASAGRD